MRAGQSLLLIFRHLWHRRWQFHHVMAMGVSIRAVQAAPTAPTVRRGTDNDFIDLLYRNYRAVMSTRSGLSPAFPPGGRTWWFTLHVEPVTGWWFRRVLRILIALHFRLCHFGFPLGNPRFIAIEYLSQHRLHMQWYLLP